MLLFWFLLYLMGVTSADVSGSIDVIVWEQLCLMYYSKVRVGDIVSVEGYKVRHCYRRAGSIEVTVDSSHPVGKLYVLQSRR